MTHSDRDCEVDFSIPLYWPVASHVVSPAPGFPLLLSVLIGSSLESPGEGQ
jgi:hypothetical protein